MDSDRFNKLVEKVRVKRSVDHATIGKLQTINNESIDVPLLREKLGLSQSEFEKVFGVSEYLVKEWEKGVIKPEKPIFLLLRIADKWPDVFMTSLQDYL
jgi:DNA-binding transcriptional regulator YiaG